MEKIYQEEDSVFSSNGITYDLNYIKAVSNDPILTMDVSKLVWVIEQVDFIDEARVRKADYSTPMLITKDSGKELVVDGLHRLVKAVRNKIKTVPYRRVTEQVLKAATVKIKTPEELFKFIKANIKYHGVSKKYLYTPAEVLKNKKGHCWETAVLIHNELTTMGYECFLLYIGDKECKKLTHITVIYKTGNLYNWFEVYRPMIIKDFVSLAKCIDHIKKEKTDPMGIIDPVIKIGYTNIEPKTLQTDFFDKVYDWKDYTD